MVEEERAQTLIHKLIAQKLTIGSCESFTAGSFCATLASVPNASKVLKGGLITYATEIKKRVAKVDSNIIETYGVISPECAQAMAVSAQQVLDVDICVSFTGNAGPSAWENKPAGLVYCAISYQNDVHVYELNVHKERNEVREYAVSFLINKLIMLLDTLEREEKHEERED